MLLLLLILLLLLPSLLNAIYLVPVVIVTASAFSVKCHSSPTRTPFFVTVSFPSGIPFAAPRTPLMAINAITWHANEENSHGLSTQQK